MADSKVFIQEEPIMMWQLIEIPVTRNGDGKVPLPDIQQLRSQEGQNIIFKTLKLVTPKVLARGMLNNAVNAPLAELQKMSLVLYSEGWQRGQMVPLLMLNNEADADATTATTVPYTNTPYNLSDWRRVDLPQSFLQFANGQVSANAPYVVMIWVGYLKITGNNQPIITG